MVVRFDTALPVVDVPVPVADPNASLINVGGIMVDINNVSAQAPPSPGSQMGTAPRPVGIGNAAYINRVSDVAPPRPAPLDIPVGRASFAAPDAGDTPVAAWNSTETLRHAPAAPSLPTLSEDAPATRH
jgi:hypothetical protein